MIEIGLKYTSELTVYETNNCYISVAARPGRVSRTAERDLLPLLTALQALDIKGEVIITPYSFVATTYGILNLKQVDAAIEARRNIARKYVEALKDV